MKSQTDFHKKEIISRLLGSDQRMTDFLFEPAPLPLLRERPEILLGDSWELTPEQQLLVRASLDIWDLGSGQVFLWEMLNGLTELSFTRLMVALIEYRKLDWTTPNLTANQWNQAND